MFSECREFVNNFVKYTSEEEKTYDHSYSTDYLVLLRKRGQNYPQVK